MAWRTVREGLWLADIPNSPESRLRESDLCRPQSQPLIILLRNLEDVLAPLPIEAAR